MFVSFARYAFRLRSKAIHKGTLGFGAETCDVVIIWVEGVVVRFPLRIHAEVHSTILPTDLRIPPPLTLPIDIPLHMTNRRYHPTPYDGISNRIHYLQHIEENFQDSTNEVLLINIINHQDEGAVGECHRPVLGANSDAEGKIIGGADGGGAEIVGHCFEQMGVGVGPYEEGKVEVGYVAFSALDACSGGVGGAGR